MNIEPVILIVLVIVLAVTAVRLYLEKSSTAYFATYYGPADAVIAANEDRVIPHPPVDEGRWVPITRAPHAELGDTAEEARRWYEANTLGSAHLVTDGEHVHVFGMVKGRTFGAAKRMAEELEYASFSGDWRLEDERLQLAGLCIVPMPGIA